jgi:hypothetical protein
MSLNRRHFLAATGFSAAGRLLAARDSGASLTPAPQTTNELMNWSAVREQFDLTRDYIQLPKPCLLFTLLTPLRRSILPNPLVSSAL